MRLTEQNIIKVKTAEWKTLNDRLKVGVVYDSACIKPNTVLRCEFRCYASWCAPRIHLNILIDRESPSDKITELFGLFKKLGVRITNNYITDGILVYPSWGKNAVGRIDDVDILKYINVCETKIRSYVLNDCGIDITDLYLCISLIDDINTYTNVYLRCKGNQGETGEYLDFFKKFLY